mmetsp:Transcript_125987/g.268819  ORF Transcript_125987/g.268819 Transcript_125987/m.268819 type:complete len:242 (-) Transcript_125987:16-741(-)
MRVVRHQRRRQRWNLAPQRRARPSHHFRLLQTLKASYRPSRLSSLAFSSGIVNSAEWRPVDLLEVIRASSPLARAVPVLGRMRSVHMMSSDILRAVLIVALWVGAANMMDACHALWSVPVAWTSPPSLAANSVASCVLQLEPFLSLITCFQEQRKSMASLQCHQRASIVESLRSGSAHAVQACAWATRYRASINFGKTDRALHAGLVLAREHTLFSEVVLLPILYIPTAVYERMTEYSCVE